MHPLNTSQSDIPAWGMPSCTLDQCGSLDCHQVGLDRGPGENTEKMWFDKSLKGLQHSAVRDAPLDIFRG